MLRCTIWHRWSNLEAVPQCWDVRFVAVALVSKWCPNSKMLPLLWSRSGDWSPMRTYRICCCRCFGREMVSPCPNLRFVAIFVVSECFPHAQMYDLLSLLRSQSVAPTCTSKPKQRQQIVPLRSGALLRGQSNSNKPYIFELKHHFEA